MISAGTNLLIYAADPDAEHHRKAREFLASQQHRDSGFVLCELILLELYMQLRNPAVFKKPYRAREAAGYCLALKTCPFWRTIDYQPEVSQPLWEWAQDTRTPMRRIIDARIALTLLHHGVREFATANVKDFKEFAFEKVWNPCKR